jgi:hypothetical protein
MAIVSCRAKAEAVKAKERAVERAKAEAVKAKERAVEERQRQERASIVLKHQKLKHDIAENQRFLQESKQFVQKVGLARSCF